MKTLLKYSLRWILSDWKIKATVVITSLFSLAIFFMLLVKYPESSSFSMFFIFVPLSWLSLSELRFQKNIEFSQLIPFNQSLKLKVVLLYLVNLVIMNLFLYLGYLVVYLFYSPIISFTFLFNYSYFFFGYTFIFYCLKQISRRKKWVSVLTKQLLGASLLIPLLMMELANNPDFLMSDYYRYARFFIFILASLSIPLVWIWLLKVVKEIPIHDANIIEKYNKKYWY